VSTLFVTCVSDSNSVCSESGVSPLRGVMPRIKYGVALGGGCLLAYILASTPEQLMNFSWLGPIIGDRSNTLHVNAYIAGSAILVSIYIVLGALRSRQAVLNSLLHGILVLALLHQTVANFARPDIVPDDALASLASIELGMLIAMLLSADFYRAILIPIVIVPLVTLYLYVNHESVFLSGNVLRASGGGHSVVNTACVLALLAPLSFGGIVRCSHVTLRPVLATVFVAVLAALCLTASWAGALGMTVGTIGLGIATHSRQIVIAAVVTSMSLLALVVVIRLSSEIDVRSNLASKMGRLSLLRASGAEIWSSWPTGRGFSPEPLTIRNPVTKQTASSQDPHCEPLYAMEQFGFGGIALMICFAMIGIMLVRRSPTDCRPMLVGITLCFVTLSLFESTLFMVSRYPVMVLFGLFQGHLIVSQPVKEEIIR